MLALSQCSLWPRLRDESKLSKSIEGTEPRASWGPCSPAWAALSRKHLPVRRLILFDIEVFAKAAKYHYVFYTGGSERRDPLAQLPGNLWYSAGGQSMEAPWLDSK
jgi:hypothetical protein